MNPTNATLVHWEGGGEATAHLFIFADTRADGDIFARLKYRPAVVYKWKMERSA